MAERSQTTHDATWAGNYWGFRGAIVLALRDLILLRSNFSALSSTFYSAAGAVKGKRKYLYAFCALVCSEIFAVSKLYSLEKMTPGQKDVRASILFQVGNTLGGWIGRRMLNRAQSIAHSAYSAQDISEGTKILVAVLLAKISLAMYEYGLAERWVAQAEKLVKNASLPPEVLTRVCRSLGTLYCVLGNRSGGAKNFCISYVLAKEHSLVDSMNKTNDAAVRAGFQAFE